jgi:hypothetical protein
MLPFDPEAVLVLLGWGAEFATLDPHAEAARATAPIMATAAPVH